MSSVTKCSDGISKKPRLLPTTLSGCPLPIWSGPRMLRACCGATGRFGGAFAKCAPARATPTMPRWLHRSLRRSRRFWKKPSTSTPNCSGGLHDPISADHLDGRAQTIGTEYSSCEFAEQHKGVGVRLAGDRPGEAL